MRYFIRLAYNGALYHGWQIQKNAHSVQAEITEKLSLLLKEDIQLTGCGRTDTGVHAREFYAHFDVERLSLTENDLVYKLNSFLPTDIAIYNIYPVDSEMHCRFSAVSRTYKYYISTVKNPFNTEFAYYLNIPLDIELMNKACSFLFKHTDFTSFSKLHTQTSTNNCIIKRAVFEINENMIIFTITADRFLRNMVRAIVGTLLEVGKGNISPKDVDTIISQKDRSKAGFSVPAKGLFLEKVDY